MKANSDWRHILEAANKRLGKIGAVLVVRPKDDGFRLDIRGRVSIVEWGWCRESALPETIEEAVEDTFNNLKVAF